MAAAPTTTAFANFQSPGLKDGSYTVTAQIVIDPGVPKAPTFAAVQKTLQVGSDDPTLPAGSLVSVFPPENESGDYGSHLPHAVLNNPTLPWQRRLTPTAAGDAPWITILVLTDAELKQPGVTVTPDPAPSSLKTLRLPTSLFQALAPTPDELRLLTHVRKATATNKTNSVTEEDYAVVIGNRLPPQQPTDTMSTAANAFLVSLAGLGDHLPATEADATKASSSDPVDLKVLYTWRFFTIPEPRSFADVVVATNRDPPTLRLPPGPATDAATADALAMGYVPLPHALRVGGQTVSWYRGPFVPYATTRQLPTLPLSSADAATFYDPTRGMLDVSCASGWTLGRLLALNAGSFATALYNWKRVTQRATLDRVLHELDTNSTAEPAFTAASPGRLRHAAAEQGLGELLPSAFAALGGWTGEAVAPPATAEAPARRARAPRPVLQSHERARHLLQAMTDVTRIRAVHGVMDIGLEEVADEDPPPVDPKVAQIWAWLGDLNLLRSVPLFYLVPDERMLPAESIRFFHVDPSWMEALVDGALSIGRVTASDLSHDAAFQPTVRTGAAKATASARAMRKGLLAIDDGFPKPPARPVSGFLLRSSAVATWPRMEVTASGPKGPANLLRMEALGTCLICLFDQDVDTVILKSTVGGNSFRVRLFRREPGQEQASPDRQRRRGRERNGRRPDARRCAVPRPQPRHSQCCGARRLVHQECSPRRRHVHLGRVRDRDGRRGRAGALQSFDRSVMVMPARDGTHARTIFRLAPRRARAIIRRSFIVSHAERDPPGGDGAAAELERPRVPTVSDAIKQLNSQYGWTLPTVDDFAASSVLHDIWSLPAEIADQLPNSLKFQATTAPFNFAPSLSGSFVVAVEADTQALEVPSVKQGGRSWQGRPKAARRNAAWRGRR